MRQLQRRRAATATAATSVYAHTHASIMHDAEHIRVGENPLFATDQIGALANAIGYAHHVYSFGIKQPVIAKNTTHTFGLVTSPQPHWNSIIAQVGESSLSACSQRLKCSQLRCHELTRYLHNFTRINRCLSAPLLTESTGVREIITFMDMMSFMHTTHNTCRQQNVKHEKKTSFFPALGKNGDVVVVRAWRWNALLHGTSCALCETRFV